jgi:hypothetical protein
MTAVDHNPLGPTMALECLAQKPLSRSEVSPLAEPEFNSVTVAVDGAIQISPLAADLDVCLINMSFARHRPLAPIELFQQERRIVNCPAVDGRVVHMHASLGHHLLKIAQAQAVSQVPPDTEQDD